jgi:hypothetical protein
MAAQFDFDLMVRLAREAPAEFARKREELILDAIASFRSPDEGHRFQSEIDSERLRSAPGEQAYLAIATKMAASLAKLSALLAAIQSLAGRETVRH